MYGFTCTKVGNQHCFEHLDLGFRMYVNNDGSGLFYLMSQGNVVHIPTIYEINLGGFRNPQKYDNIRHDIIHVIYWLLQFGEFSPNHTKLCGCADTPLWRTHWEEYKVESLELYIMTGIKRESLGCYEQAFDFYLWMMRQLFS